MLILVSGGAASGKSAFAEELLVKGGVGLLLADVELQGFKFIVRHNDYFLSSVKCYLWCLEHRGYIRPKRKFALTKVSK